MEELEDEVEVVVGEEVQEQETQIVRDEKGRYPKGVSGNKNGRPKGTSWAAILEKVFEEELAGITKEEFMVGMVRRAHNDSKDRVAGKFVSEFMPKPKQVLEVNQTNKFVVPDIYADRKEESVDELEGGEDYYDEPDND